MCLKYSRTCRNGGMGTVRKVFMEIIANISVLSGISASRERAFYVPTSVVCDKDVNLLCKAPA